MWRVVTLISRCRLRALQSGLAGLGHACLNARNHRAAQAANSHDSH